MHEAIGTHLRGLIEDGMPAPKSHSSATFVAVQTDPGSGDYIKDRKKYLKNKTVKQIGKEILELQKSV